MAKDQSLRPLKPSSAYSLLLRSSVAAAIVSIMLQVQGNKTRNSEISSTFIFLFQGSLGSCFTSLNVPNVEILGQQ